jgi:hypothetical protein
MKHLILLYRGKMNLKRFASKTCSPHKINFNFAPSLSTSTICFLSVHPKGSKDSIFSILQKKRRGGGGVRCSETSSDKVVVYVIVYSLSLALITSTTKNTEGIYTSYCSQQSFRCLSDYII